MGKRNSLFLVLLIFASQCYPQVSTVKIMAWNLLNWPLSGSPTADSTSRCPSFREVVQAAAPDIIVTEENNTTYSTIWFLDAVMNAHGNHYSQGTYIQGYDTNNGIFFKDSLFHFVSNTRIPTPLRDVNMFTLVFIPTNDTIRIFAVHLKAGNTLPSEPQERASEVDSIRKVTNSFPAGTEFLVCGDFNIYGDFEASYQGLLQDNSTDDGNFNDPIFMTGTWNNSAYSHYHTQSTRAGTTGGLDDRFDMILVSNGMLQSSGFYYVPGSTVPFGNDGNHYNLSINSGVNTVVSQTVADALFNSSDHLPIIASFQVGPTSGIEDISNELSTIDLYPNPAYEKVFIHGSLHNSKFAKISVRDFSGRIVVENQSKLLPSGSFNFELPMTETLKSGIFFVSIEIDNSLINRKLIIIK